jgi:hypothetical protein
MGEYGVLKKEATDGYYEKVLKVIANSELGKNTNLRVVRISNFKAVSDESKRYY